MIREYENLLRCGKSVLLNDTTTADDVTVYELFRELAVTKRFSGKLTNSLSVLEHTLICVRIAEVLFNASTEDKYAILMHDVEEAVLTDIGTPVKMLLLEEGSWGQRNYSMWVDYFEERFSYRNTPLKRMIDYLATCMEGAEGVISDAQAQLWNAELAEVIVKANRDFVNILDRPLTKSLLYGVFHQYGRELVKLGEYGQIRTATELFTKFGGSDANTN